MEIILTEEVAELIEDLDSKAQKGNKDARIKKERIEHCFTILLDHGTWIGEPTVKHLEDEIWELRPGNYRLLFTIEGDYIILTFFVKKTNKTPRKEIERAKKEYKKYLDERDK
ncbi:MAG: type II toxin-antitoxin system RelE/ParE family toxin [Clostridiales bacterium]